MQLEQTPFLRLVLSHHVAQALRLMEKPPDTQLTPDVAREVCQRSGATIEAEGSVAELGSQYLVGLNALDCRTGDILAHEQTIARVAREASLRSEVPGLCVRHGHLRRCHAAHLSDLA